MKLGFIGLGDMGAPMVRHLLAGGHQVVVWNRSKHKTKELMALGAQLAETPVQVLRQTNLLGLCLSSHIAVEQVCNGEQGLIAAARLSGTPLSVVVDFSTGSPQATCALAEAARAKGIAWIDAPVSGGPAAASNGTLTALVGGDADSVERARPLLDAVAARVTHLGPTGSGQTAKLCNQLIVACNVLAMAEAIALARKAGVNASLLTQALLGGFADSQPFQIFAPRMATHCFEPKLGSIELMEKDVGLASELATSLAAVAPMLDTAHTLFARSRGISAIHGGGDLSQAILLFETLKQ